MNNVKRVVIVTIVLCLVGVAFALRAQSKKEPVEPRPTPQEKAQSTPSIALPRLVDLGSDRCASCKLMVPVLEELKKKYAKRLQVDFVDVWKTPGAGKQYAVRVIPTQIFYDSQGNELFRHEGFISKEEILGKWRAFGLDLSETSTD